MQEMTTTDNETTLLKSLVNETVNRQLLEQELALAKTGLEIARDDLRDLERLLEESQQQCSSLESERDDLTARLETQRALFAGRNMELWQEVNALCGKLEERERLLAEADEVLAASEDPRAQALRVKIAGMLNREIE
jgi:hypothetical protein